MGRRSGRGSAGHFFHGFHRQLRTWSLSVTSPRLFRGNQFASKGILEIFTDDSDSVSIFLGFWNKEEHSGKGSAAITCIEVRHFLLAFVALHVSLL